MSLPIPVAAFVASEVEVQRDQFVRVNNTQPLPRGLVAELLPQLSGPVPRKLTAFQAPAVLCERLQRDGTSPFHGLVRLASSAGRKRGTEVVAGTALLSMIHDSFDRPTGCLFALRHTSDGSVDLEAAFELLRTYWTGVREAFPEAWGLPPTRSRLMHSIGIRSMGRLMDRVMSVVRNGDVGGVEAELGRIRDRCRWTSGSWDEVNGLEWDALQLVPAHLRALSDYLVRSLSERLGSGVKFFLPDSQDVIDPGYDFETEGRRPDRCRQRTESYAYEVFSRPVCDGILVSKGIVDGHDKAQTRFSLGQRCRLLGAGVHEYFRISDPARRMPVMGDCGAFTYVNDPRPPYSVDELIEFYREGRFDYGVSLDHIVPMFRESWDTNPSGVPRVARERQELTLKLAEQFLRRSKAGVFVPVGVAQGWSPSSFASAVERLQAMGYRNIAIGGMASAKDSALLATLRAIDRIRRTECSLHLLGIRVTTQLSDYQRLGVTSFDTTSPLRQAFKDDLHNYHTLERDFVAVRVRQSSHPSIQRLVASGAASQLAIERLERMCLSALADFDRGRANVDDVLSPLLEYEALQLQGRDDGRAGTDRVSLYGRLYREVLEASPWKICPCEVCSELGHQVILLRGSERSRRRGFHNLWVFYRRLERTLSDTDCAPAHSRRRFMPQRAEFRFPALEIPQTRNRSLYVFAADGKVVPEFASVSRARRRDRTFEGYQRGEVRSIFRRFESTSRGTIL